MIKAQLPYTKDLTSPAEAAAPGAHWSEASEGNPWLVASHLRENENDSSLVV